MIKTTRFFLLIVLAYIVIVLTLSLALAGTHSGFYYPSMTRFSFWVMLLQFVFTFFAVRSNGTVKVLSAVFCAMAVPFFSSLFAQLLFDKGNGLLRFADLHLLAWVILFILTVIVVHGINFLSSWRRIRNTHQNP
jgi:hypothetical protein